MGIGSTLQRLIESQGTNVNEVATATGVNPQTLYSLIKRDSTKANIDDLYKVAKYLGVSLDYFYSGYLEEAAAKKEPPAGVAAPTGDSPEEIRAYLDGLFHSLGFVQPGQSPSRGQQCLMEAILAMIAAYRAGQEESK